MIDATVVGVRLSSKCGNRVCSRIFPRLNLFPLSFRPHTKIYPPRLTRLRIRQNVFPKAMFSCL